MDTHQELLRLQREIAQALQEQSTADKEANVAQTLYDKALANWEAENAAIVAKKNRTAQNKVDAKKKLESLREEAKSLLGERFIEGLPDGFNQKREKIVKLESQGFLQQARENFPFLLKVDIEAAEKFFKAMAVEQEDGAYIIPEHIRRWANVEVVTKPKPEISDAKLIKLVFDVPDETQPLDAVTQAIEVIEKAEEAWTPPANATALLTAPELPIIQDYSSEGESLPMMNRDFLGTDTWKGTIWAADREGDEEEVDAVPDIPLSKYGSVPPTEDINF